MQGKFITLFAVTVLAVGFTQAQTECQFADIFDCEKAANPEKPTKAECEASVSCLKGVISRCSTLAGVQDALTEAEKACEQLKAGASTSGKAATEVVMATTLITAILMKCLQ